MYSPTEITYHAEPAWIRAHTVLQALHAPPLSRLPIDLPGMVVCALLELTDYLTHEPVLSPQPQPAPADPEDAVRELTAALAELITDSTDLDTSLRLTRALDYAREAAAILAAG